ncbi:MAG: hypothetical protein P1V51_01040 [Deltaproteobacteria bacterium]|nr:hypothetical protein [Deltaproteobacteria bacterium]
MRTLIPLFLLALLLPACPSGTDDGSLDGGRPDAALGDAGESDGGDPDGGADDGGTPDGGDPDGGADDGGTGPIDPLAGFGGLSGDCWVLDTELTDPTPSIHVNHLDFALDPYDHPADYDQLTPGGQVIIDTQNAGGSSEYSELFSYEVLARCEGAALLKTETEIVYDTAGAITDILVNIDGQKIGVSVTRAMIWPLDDPFPVSVAQARLEDKLAGVIASSANVSAGDAWVKQILHFIAYGQEHADSLVTAFDLVDPALKADTIVYVTVSDGDDLFIYQQ